MIVKGIERRRMNNLMNSHGRERGQCQEGPMVALSSLTPSPFADLPYLFR